VQLLGSRRPRLIQLGLSLELALVVVALAMTAATGHGIHGAVRDTTAGTLAVALGIQNAVVRQLRVPDLTTTVLTMTLTGIAADIRTAPRPTVVRRVLAVATMLGGAVGGALLEIRVSPAAALGVAAGMVAVTLVALLAWRGEWS
jgi:uncharacterized membrane protein YoaK (UPF0700 family)